MSLCDFHSHAGHVTVPEEVGTVRPCFCVVTVPYCVCTGITFYDSRVYPNKPVFIKGGAWVNFGKKMF